MPTSSLQQLVLNLLEPAGISLTGKNPWDIRIHDEAVVDRVLQGGSLALGESYMEGAWDCEQLDQFFTRILTLKLDEKIIKNKWLVFKILLYRFFNFQTHTKSFIVGKHHYDLGNDLFEAMLDKNMNYTCGYWRGADTLDEAQLHKLDLVCRKLMLKPGMRLLDIGCGFGALAKYAAENYQVEVVGVTISQEQHHYAQRLCADLPIEIRFQDYRAVQGKFDRVVSLGMFEHVGHLNYRTYLQKVSDSLEPQGIFLLHTIGNNISTVCCDPWIEKYIFPNGMLPSISQIGKAAENLFIMEDWHNFGLDYDQTLMAWFANFKQNWSQLSRHYDEKFYRMWSYYLLSCAGCFRARNAQLWQIVFSKGGLTSRYDAPR